MVDELTNRGELIAVVHNPQSGRGRSAAVADLVAKRIARYGSRPLRFASDTVDAIAEVIAAAVDRGAKRVVLVGGDGFIHRSLPALVNTTTTVGLVSGGSGNDIIRGLGLARTMATQIEIAVAGRSDPIDIISVERPDHSSLLAASIVTGGISGVINRRANSMTKVPGASRYALATLLELPRLQPSPVSLELDGEAVELKASMIAVANTSHFGGGMAICPEATPTDGLLDVLLVDATSPLVMGTVFPLVYLGQHVRHRAVTTRRVSTVRINPGFDLWADGELLVEADSGPVQLSAKASLLVAGAGAR